MANVTRDEAARHLRDIAATERRSWTAYGYAASAPFLILWGVIWMVGYATSDLRPAVAPIVWGVLVVVGVLAGFVLVGGHASSETNRSYAWRMAAAWLAVAVFVFAFFAVLPPVDSKQVGAIIPLLCALAYVLLGLWTGVRIVTAGLLLGALTLGGFFYLPSHFDLWMAVIGGGALILLGTWMRRI